MYLMYSCGAADNIGMCADELAVASFAGVCPAQESKHPRTSSDDNSCRSFSVVT